jgi:hypothetical protein
VPVLTDTLPGVAIMTVPTDDVRGIIVADDPCGQAGMMTVEVHPCVGFPGDALPG